jgi:hypothetical protein
MNLLTTAFRDHARASGKEGTQFSNYRLYGYDWLDNRFVALTVYRAAKFLKDNGWEGALFGGTERTSSR